MNFAIIQSAVDSLNLAFLYLILSLSSFIDWISGFEVINSLFSFIILLLFLLFLLSFILSSILLFYWLNSFNRVWLMLVVVLVVLINHWILRIFLILCWINVWDYGYYMVGCFIWMGVYVIVWMVVLNVELLFKI